MNVFSDLRNIDQTVTRLRKSRSKLLGQAINIRKAIAMLVADQPGSKDQIIDLLDDAAAILENELNSAAGP